MNRIESNRDPELVCFVWILNILWFCNWVLYLLLSTTPHFSLNVKNPITIFSLKKWQRWWFTDSFISITVAVSSVLTYPLLVTRLPTTDPHSGFLPRGFYRRLLFFFFLNPQRESFLLPFICGCRLIIYYIIVIIYFPFSEIFYLLYGMDIG